MEKVSYHDDRLGKSLQLTYRLRRRTKVVIDIFKKYPNVSKILDIGTADGLMLSKIKSEFSRIQCFGIDISYELLKTNKDNRIQLLQADASNIPFKNNTFDVIIATAFIEHLSQPLHFLKQSFSLLKNNGLIIITSPVPFWFRFATIFRLYIDSGHKKLYGLNFLKNILEQVGFKIIKLEKFMISPIGFPFETKLEWFF